MNAKVDIEVAEVEIGEALKVNEIISVVVHTLKKEEKAFVLDLAGKPLNVSEIIQKTTDSIVGQYSGKLGKSHGNFEANAVSYPFQSVLDDCLEGRKDFFESTVVMMDLLLERVKRTTANGGHVFFVNYKRKRGDDQLTYFMVAILHDELGAAITAGKDVVESKYLDIKGLRFAGLVDVNSWKAGNERYLSFIKGKEQDKVSEFFKLFLGCDNAVRARDESKKIKILVEAFGTHIGLNSTQIDELFAKAYEICYRYSKSETDFTVDAFSNELVPDKADEFKDFIANSDLKFSEGFVPVLSAIKNMVRFAGKGKGWKIDFNRDVLGTEVIFNSQTNTLTIKNLPDELVAELTAEEEEDE